jgi:glycerol-3-phosphate acyltransferase PlsY
MEQAKLMIFLIAYLLGSIPFGLIFSKFLISTDLRKIGSGNIGTTNAFRTGNKMVGILTLIFDTLKGVAAYEYAILSGYDLPTAFIAGMVSIVGHIFPIWLMFKGGKGIATAFGVLLIAYPSIACVSLLVWGIVAKLFKISSVAGMMSLTLASLALFSQASFQESLAFLGVACLILYRHKDNIKRLLEGNEK